MMKYLLILLFFAASAFTTAQETVILQPGSEGKDTFVSSYEPGLNKGDRGELYVMSWTFYGGNPGSQRTFIEFDLDFLGTTAEIIDARLNLYYYVNPSNPGLSNYGDNEAFIRRVITPWEENVITWNDQPLMTEENKVYLPPGNSSNQDYLDIDVTQLVRDMVADPQNSFGFGIKLITEDFYRAIPLASSDHEFPLLHPKLVVVYKNCDPPAVSFNYSSTDQTVQFESVCPSATRWSWDFGDGYSASLENPLHAYAEKGKYLVCLTAEDSCGGSIYCDTVKVCEMPVAGFTFSVQDQVYYFTDTSHYAEDYWWDFGDMYYSAQQSPVHTYDSAGAYMVCLTTRNECGSDKAYSVVIVELSGVGENSRLPVIVYPNPAREHLFIAGDVKGGIQLELLNLHGVAVVQKEVELMVSPVMIGLTGIRPGIYILQLKTETLQMNHKVIIL
jgi:PKD repeat protein